MSKVFICAAIPDEQAIKEEGAPLRTPGCQVDHTLK